MAFVSIQGVNHYYQWITPHHNIPDARKPTIVFLHGWAGSTRYWQSTAQHLQSDFNALLYDLRGFGRSRLPDPSVVEGKGLRDYRLESYAEDLRDLLDALGLDRVYLNAHSTGASIAAVFLQQYPERVYKAILTCSGIFEYEEVAFKIFHWVSGYVVKFRPQWFLQIPELDRMFMSRFLYQPIPANDRRAFLEDFLQADAAAAIGTVYTAVSKEAAEQMPQVFQRITVPTLLVSGEYDQIIPAAMGRNAANLSPAIEYCCLPRTAHFPMLENPPLYLEKIQHFLNHPGAE
ncbi:MAG: alpha/beta fold hydrolase [Prochlorotrichaceae cyanobacterium]